MPFAWTAIYLMNVINGATSLERETERETGRSDSLDRRASALLGQYDSFRKKSRDLREESFTRHGSLERQRATPDKRSSWSSEDLGEALSDFRPVTLTLTSFFKQVSHTV
jgi:molybdenum-dependent DNA-binding transcriptional regulator ModE